MPEENLTICYIHGYRSFDTRNNVKWNKDGKVLYHTAGVAISLDPELNKQKYFTRHNEDIVCLTVDNTGSIAATGQIAEFGHEVLPVIYVWNTCTMQALALLKGFHRKAVRHVSWCNRIVGVFTKWSLFVVHRR